MKVRRNQGGAALILLVFVLSLVMTAYLLHTLDSTEIQNQKNRKTAEALAQAKQGLLAYAGAVDLTVSCTTSTNCPRPGDLPCPDADDDGYAEATCGNASGSTGQAARLGRLPWKTLGLPDLRDGEGERLWYAVSSRYKNNSRYRPLNSDTTGTITLRDAKNNILYNGISDGLAAVVIAPGSAITRQDTLAQDRTCTVGINCNTNNVCTTVPASNTPKCNPANYLDILVSVEDNSNFVDASTNGFISGLIKNAAGAVILNDQIIAINRDEMNRVMETRVLGEVSAALQTYYSASRSYPYPADIDEPTCLGNGDLTVSASNCVEGSNVAGRIPANPTSWSATSPLRGGNLSNWFQLNAWRELIFYAVSYKCVTTTTNCGGFSSWLTLNNALVTPTNTKHFVLISAGKSLSFQTRASTADKINKDNYLEGENQTWWDEIYVRTKPLTSSINDRVVSLP